MRLASKDEAKRAIYAACGNDKDQAISLWNHMLVKHGNNWEAMIADCATPENA